MIKRNLILLLIPAITITGIILNSCYYDNSADLYKYYNTACDSSTFTYSTKVAVIMQNYCNSCHSSASASGGIITDNYTSLKALANNQKLWQAVSWTGGIPTMPKDGNKLSDCDLAIIQKWIKAGAPNN